MELFEIEVSEKVVAIDLKKNYSWFFWFTDQPWAQADTMQIFKETTDKVGHENSAGIDYVYTGNRRWTLYSVHLAMFSQLHGLQVTA